MKSLNQASRCSWVEKFPLDILLMFLQKISEDFNLLQKPTTWPTKHPSTNFSTRQHQTDVNAVNNGCVNLRSTIDS